MLRSAAVNAGLTYHEPVVDKFAAQRGDIFVRGPEHVVDLAFGIVLSRFKLLQQVSEHDEPLLPRCRNLGQSVAIEKPVQQPGIFAFGDGRSGLDYSRPKLGEIETKSVIVAINLRLHETGDDEFGKMVRHRSDRELQPVSQIGAGSVCLRQRSEDADTGGVRERGTDVFPAASAIIVTHA